MLPYLLSFAQNKQLEELDQVATVKAKEWLTFLVETLHQSFCRVSTWNANYHFVSTDVAELLSSSNSLSLTADSSICCLVFPAEYFQYFAFIHKNKCPL